jgi:hypothetical protein
MTRQKYRHLVVLNKIFLMPLASGLIPKNDFVLLRIGINSDIPLYNIDALKHALQHNHA